VIEHLTKGVWQGVADIGGKAVDGFFREFGIKGWEEARRGGVGRKSRTEG
jgi:hypothetical protein